MQENNIKINTKHPFIPLTSTPFLEQALQLLQSIITVHANGLRLIEHVLYIVGGLMVQSDYYTYDAVIEYISLYGRQRTARMGNIPVYMLRRDEQLYAVVMCLIDNRYQCYMNRSENYINL